MLPLFATCVTLATLASCQKTLVNPFPKNYAGVGVELTMREEAPIVVRTIAGGPAAVAGLLPDDQLLAIDNASIAGMGLADIVVRLRGEEGSTVLVTLRRQGQELAANITRRSMQKDGDDYSAKLRAAAK
ncbi:MAG: PDZ domain-containing protein [Deltaproteobacteria bacterium]|nr:PDZ domain-containing protein [Deltaproteobacteria bacterium]